MTKGQTALMESFLSSMDEGTRGLYSELLFCLNENGYKPYRVRSSIVFKHKLHNKQIAKMGMKGSKEKFHSLLCAFLHAGDTLSGLTTS